MGLLPNSFRYEIFTIFIRKLSKFVRNIWIFCQILINLQKNLEIAVENGVWQQFPYTVL